MNEECVGCISKYSNVANLQKANLSLKIPSEGWQSLNVNCMIKM